MNLPATIPAESKHPKLKATFLFLGGVLVKVGIAYLTGWAARKGASRGL